MGPDGALYISEDMHGRIWRVTYHGAADAAPTPAPAPKAAGVTSGEPGPPEGTHPDAGRTVLASLPLPAGATAEQVALGERIFHGEAADGTCAGCHGSDANGRRRDHRWSAASGSTRMARSRAFVTPSPMACRSRRTHRRRCRRAAVRR
jgi:mono/diheme cytochrome c family protein